MRTLNKHIEERYNDIVVGSMGYGAYQAGLELSSNPFAIASRLAQVWGNGYRLAKTQGIKSIRIN